MKTGEVILGGVFFTLIVMVSVLINSPKVRTNTQANQVVEQQDAKYNAIEKSEDDIQLATDLN